jgi:cell division protein ZipA
MDIGLREWLMVIGIVVIAGILFDGWRRMSGSKSKLKFKLDRTLADLPDDEEDANLLGPARVLDRDREPQIDESNLPSMTAGDSAGKRNEPQQGDLNLDQPVPTLLTPVAEEAAEPVEKPKPAAAEQTEVQEVLVISVVAREADGFKGPALLQNILESGLRFGDMDIFHRHESMAGNGEILFSMANAKKPGTFDLDDMDMFSTPVVSFFLQLPGPRHPKQAFDLMIAAARKLSTELNGDLKDDKRSVLTAQTIEHYRQRIAEFERKLLSHKR